MVPHVRLIRARREAADEKRPAVAVVGPPGLGGRARLKLNDRELELTNLLGLVLGCIEAKRF